MVEISFSERFGSPFESTYPGRLATEYLHLLSLILLYEIFDPRHDHAKIEGFTEANVPHAPVGEPRLYQNRFLNDDSTSEILLPKDMDMTLDSYFILDPASYETFRNAAYLFYAGVQLERGYKIHSFISLISCLETFINSSYPNEAHSCKACGQKVHSVSKKFRHFISVMPYVKDNAYLNRLYSMRSKLLHNGQILLSDRMWQEEYRDALGSKDDDYFDRKNLIKIVRVCLLNWLINNVVCEGGFQLRLDT
jgi:hypothetical protein